ncbi:hypothetical protein PIROE2DRAFT_61100 [Piromyces sp. E2]|nr:hypothetical protein PIROE2DRAFT_61100 [Piromyces sp. E2]|eukprot:OUM63721.1 hypothetical protein PIROE2DRAFT_61100 [Piromyces sp. E2]
MQFKQILSGLLLLGSTAFAGNIDNTGNCKEIKNRLGDYKLNLQECRVNSFGEVVSLGISPYCLKEKDIAKILAYDTIDKLVYSNTGVYDYYDECGENGLKQFPRNAISKIGNLREVDLSNFVTLKKGDLTSLPDSVLQLVIGDVTITQDIINDLSKLTNLKTLEFRYSSFKDGLNYKALSNLNLNSLTITNREKQKSYDSIGEPKSVPKNFLKYFKSVEEFKINYARFSKAVLNEIGQLTNLEELQIKNGNFEEDATLDSFKI